MDRNKWFMLVTGIAIGIIAVVLVKLGNPPNMGFCIACFERDIAGALGLHHAPLVQYMRPEIAGIVLGAMLTALFAGEFRTRGGSATLVRFIMGMFMMIGALVFLGCPLRDVLRMAGGDYNAIVGLAGFICGVGTGVFFLKRGFDLGRARPAAFKLGGFILPAIMLFFLILLFQDTVFNPETGGPLFFSTTGPGSMAAPVLISLGAGVLVGLMSQRVRLCFSGGIRDLLLVKDYTLLLGFIGVFIGALSLNVFFGFFKPGFSGQPVAHSVHIWNFLGLYLVGLTAALLGGCPLRQLVMSGEGDMDAASVVIGMIVGAAFCHNFMLASSAAKAAAAGVPAVVGGPGIYGQIACIAGIIIVAIIGWTIRED
ncbi:MAG TPA: YedE family putative selenium transporter [Syntrophomonadaceae bacterium]|nr:YedE family putative selenium transporter [Syntrophomonadaceae bacterium]